MCKRDAPRVDADQGDEPEVRVGLDDLVGDAGETLRDAGLIENRLWARLCRQRQPLSFPASPDRVKGLEARGTLTGQSDDVGSRSGTGFARFAASAPSRRKDSGALIAGLAESREAFSDDEDQASATMSSGSLSDSIAWMAASSEVSGTSTFCGASSVSA